MTQSLQEFIRQRGPRRTTCFVCNLPADIRQQLNEGRANGIYPTAARTWLIEELGLEGVPTADTLAGHWKRQHD